MTKFMNSSFSVPIGGTKSYDEGYERTFGKRVINKVGDATHPEGDGIRVIIHICNDQGKWNKGFVLSLSKRWREPKEKYIEWYKSRNETKNFELGEVQFVQVENDVYVANIIGQHGIYTLNNVPPIRYDAVKKGLEKIRSFVQANSASVHMPRKMGCGLAGGDLKVMDELIREELSKHGVEVFKYELKND